MAAAKKNQVKAQPLQTEPALIAKLVKAYVRGTAEALTVELQSLQDAAARTPYSPVVDALQKAVSAVRRVRPTGGMPWAALQRASAAVTRVTENQPEALPLLLMLADIAANSAAQLGLLEEAERISHRAQSMLTPDIPLPLVTRLFTSEIVYQWIAQRCETHERTIERAMAFLPEKSEQWFIWKRRHAFFAIENRDLQTAAARVAEYERIRADSTDIELAVLKAALFCEAGEPEEGLAFSDAVPAPSRARMTETRYWGWRFMLLLKNGAFQDAERLIRMLRKKHPTPHTGPAAWAVYQARMALARRDPAALKRYALQVLDPAMKAAQVWRDRAMHLLAKHALISGSAQTARTILTRLDPQADKPACHAEWARLHLLEGDEEQAAHCFRKLLVPDFPYRGADKLRWAYELSAWQTARLLVTSDMPTPDTSKVVEVPGVQMQATPVNGDEAHLIGESEAIRSLQRKIGRFAARRTPVLITGETGVGKEVAARLLHQNSPWADEPFVAVNCGALSGFLIESELFGHTKGAFSGAARSHEGLFCAAGKGTILLDEIHTLSTDLQAKLLRVLENGEIRAVGSTKVRKTQARVIATTNEPVEKAVESGKFRKDLFYRLARLHIHIPPLRERKQDIALLAKHFLALFETGPRRNLDTRLLRAMTEYDWPGNVRELRNEVERMLIAAEAKATLTADAFGPYRTGKQTCSRSAKPDGRATAPRPLPDGTRLATPDRRDRLLELFRSAHTLTRKEAAHLLHCAPATAARDLAALEKKGLIRRVITSAHLRTSYFELCEE